MKIRAISDLHLASPANRAALRELPKFHNDWLLLAGDIAERIEQIRLAFEILTTRFAKVFWVPGNHELWAVPEEPGQTPIAGEARYRTLVALARDYGVITPEDPFQIWSGPGGEHLIAPLFVLYDYSFRPDWIDADAVIPWARETGTVCADELFLDPSPWPSREAWCAARFQESEQRLADIPPALPTILLNHYPLRRDLIDIPRAPRFTPWCGTRKTENWHRRFNANVVVSGHLHTRRTDVRDGTRFEEVSLGYPRDWDQRLGIQPYLREILPG